MPRPYLVSHDIADPKRLVRLHRALKKQATPIQYSVFLGMFTAAHLDRCAETIRAIIDRRVDDVRIYPLPPGAPQRRLGRPTLPAGIELTLLPAAFRAMSPESAPAAEAGPAPAPEAAPGARGPRIPAAGRTGRRAGFQLIR
jgi:CRISPR-associated protein Cas2